MITGIMIASGVVVVAGTWMSNKNLTAKMALGASFAGLGLVVLEMADEQLARDLALLIFLAVLFVPFGGHKTSYGDDVFKSIAGVK